MNISTAISLFFGAYIAHGDPVLISTCCVVLILILSSSEMGYRNDDWLKLYFSTALSTLLTLYSWLGLFTFSYPLTLGIKIWRDKKIKDKLRKDITVKSKSIDELEEEPDCDEN